MIDFGKTLRESREAKGYSVSQLAEATHILPQIIESLEREDFSKIVAPIYGRGFVKLYCEAIGVDAKPLIDEFMDIYNGNRPPSIRLKPVEDEGAVAEPAAPEPAAPEPERIAAAEPPVYDFAPLSETPAISEPPQADLLPPADVEKPSGPRRRYRLPEYSIPEVPRSYWRFGLLIIATALILTLIYFGCRALYRATMRPPVESPAAEGPAARRQAATTPPPAAAPARDAQKTKTPRKPVALPPLYID